MSEPDRSPEAAPFYVRPLDKKMGTALARRTVFRTQDQEDWGRVAARVAEGNTSLVPGSEADFAPMRDAIAKGALLMSGRHLQHGDPGQKHRNMEVYTNCAVAASSFMTFYLLLNGSGVGRDYSDAMMRVDWEQAPELVLVCRPDHPNFDAAVFVAPAEALQRLAGQSHVYFMVPDSREGWAMAAEKYEVMTYEAVHAESTLVLDFSYVRPAGSPIAGMQNRPASGPVPTAQAFAKIAQVKGQGLPRWKQAMLVDHALAECVVVGGARRSARMSTKYWADPGAIEFAHIKAQHGLWSSNNSIIATQALFDGLKQKNSWAQQVFKAVTEASYWDLTGEPGFICVDNFAPDPIDYSIYADGNYVGSELYELQPSTRPYMAELAQAAQHMPYSHLTNPCVTADTWIQTTEGPRQVAELIGKPFTALVGQQGHAATGFFQTGVKPVFRVETQRGYSLRLTDNHQVLVERKRSRKLDGGFNIEHAWVEVKDLKPGDKLVIDNHRGTSWEGDGSFEEGWLLGQIVGDGGYNADKSYKAYVRFWGPNKEKLQQVSAQYAMAAGLKSRSDCTGVNNAHHQTSQYGSVALERLASSYLSPQGKQLMPALEKTSSGFYRGFLRGFFDADGTVLFNTEKGRSVRLAQSDLGRLQVVQRMLARLGIASTLYQNRRAARQSLLPDGRGGLKLYPTKAVHELVIARDNLLVFAEQVGFNDPAKAEKLEACVSSLGVKRQAYRDAFTSQVTAIMPDGVEPVYDCTVDDVHRFDANGLVVHNCGEISLNILGGFCVIGDVVPYHCDTLEEAEETFRIAARALIRVNTMRSVYPREVARTNRIGVSFTGIHEFAFKQFGLGFREVLDEHGAGKPFWEALARFSRAVKAEAKAYATELGMAVPVTDTTVKPAGSTSKLFALSEGAHLPSMREYLRNMQFRSDDPLVEQYRAKGYPVRELRTYQGTSIVGFPTQPTICRLGMGDKLVTAAEATPEEQYRWLMLLEKYWIRGVDEQGQPLPDTGNQISYTLKYDPAQTTYKDFVRMMVKYQSQIRCCSVMPTTDTSAYEYLPEQPFRSVGQFQAIIGAITDPEALEDIDMEHLQCQSGACPI
jgi:intein-encoded DNA endonuclease-like protein